MKRIAVMFCVALFCLNMLAQEKQQLQPAGPDAHYIESVKTIMKLTGIEQLSMQMLLKMFDSFREPENEKALDEFIKSFNINEFIDGYVPIYYKYYTQEDLDAMIAFYSSPSGQKILSTMPEVMNEGMEYGKKYGQSLAQRVVEKLEAAKRDKAAATNGQ